MLLDRYTVAICAHFGAIAPASIEPLPWWQFEQMCEYVDLKEEAWAASLRRSSSF